MKKMASNKKRNLIIGASACLLVGIGIGLGIGTATTKHKYVILMHDSIVSELNKVHEDLQVVAHDYYIKQTHNAYGDGNEECINNTILFVSTFLEEMVNKRKKEETLLPMKQEVLYKNGKAALVFTDKSMYVEYIKSGFTNDPLYITSNIKSTPRIITSAQ